ncbi:hypothetical protein [Bacillus alkalisoli]|uniref:hypothetical protein n=1 Tax=Bacillus alkalisoli TaxID=2011008 RepID=UPI000C249DE3|nr:hypothetical protein [Bacillus alkalisoli]
MSEEKKKLYLNLLIGYLGILLIFIAGVRYILITEDIVGRSLMLLSVICLGTCFRYVESQLLSTRKEKLIIQSIYIIGILIVFVIGLYIIQTR